MEDRKRIVTGIPLRVIRIGRDGRPLLSYPAKVASRRPPPEVLRRLGPFQPLPRRPVRRLPTLRELGFEKPSPPVWAIFGDSPPPA